MNCSFCNKVVEADHIEVCPTCGGQAHRQSEDEMECATCGAKYKSPKRKFLKYDKKAQVEHEEHSPRDTDDKVPF